MDPEPEQNPFEAPAEEVPQPMTMERSNSSESGSNSSVSTIYFAKKSGSAASSRSGSGASTSRSPPDEEIAARLLSGQPPSDDQGQIQKDDDQSGKNNIISQPDAEEKKKESVLVTKADSAGGFDYTKPEGPIKELEKGADKIVTEVGRTEIILIKEAEEGFASCCDCCKSCTRVCCTGVCGDVFAVLCCPFTVISLLSCICFRCPKLFATKTAEKVKARRKPVLESEFEQSTEAATEGSITPTVNPSPAKHVHGSGHAHHDDKPGDTTTTKLKSPGEQSQKLAANVDAHRKYFFPSPEVGDDHPGGDKASTR